MKILHLATLPDDIRRAITGRARLVQASRFTTSVMANHYIVSPAA